MRKKSAAALRSLRQNVGVAKPNSQRYFELTTALKSSPNLTAEENTDILRRTTKLSDYFLSDDRFNALEAETALWASGYETLLFNKVSSRTEFAKLLQRKNLLDRVKPADLQTALQTLLATAEIAQWTDNLTTALRSLDQELAQQEINFAARAEPRAFISYFTALRQGLLRAAQTLQEFESAILTSQTLADDFSLTELKSTLEQKKIACAQYISTHIEQAVILCADHQQHHGPQYFLDIISQLDIEQPNDDSQESINDLYKKYLTFYLLANTANNINLTDSKRYNDGLAAIASIINDPDCSQHCLHYYQ
jgi:hypothetical protein